MMTTAADPATVVNSTELAEICGVGVSAIHNWRYAGILPDAECVIGLPGKDRWQWALADVAPAILDYHEKTVAQVERLQARSDRQAEAIRTLGLEALLEGASH